MGEIGILNVGAGDTKLTFDKNNPAECIRSGRIVTDMLRRGYALLIEVKDKKGKVTYARAKEFRADVNEYIIADFDGATAEQADRETDEQPSGAAAPRQDAEAPGKGRALRLKAVPAAGTRGIAVARSAGG